MKSWLKKTVSLGRKKKEGSELVAPTPERGLLGENNDLSSAISPVRLDLDKADGSKSSKEKSDGREEVVKKPDGANRSRQASKNAKQRPESSSHRRQRHQISSSSGAQRQSKGAQQSSYHKASSHDINMAASALQGQKFHVNDTSQKGAESSVGKQISNTAGQRSALSSSQNAPSYLTSSLQSTSNSVVQFESDAELARRVAEEERAYYSSIQTSVAHATAGQHGLNSSQPPDIHLARALADSQYAARQADALSKTRESVYEAAVSKAMEESIATVDYDNLLRDIKMWTIDLSAASDDVVSALSMVSKRRKELGSKLDKALEKGDTHRVAKMLWEEEKLPEIQDRIENLQENMVPIAIAVSDLESLREKVMSANPPIGESQKDRDEIIENLFRSLRNMKLDWSNPRATEEYEIQTSEDCNDSSDLRELIASLVDDARRIPRIPDKVLGEAEAMVRDIFAEYEASVDLDESVEKSDSQNRVCSLDEEAHGAPSECKTEISSTPTEMQQLVKRNISSSAEVSEAPLRNSSNRNELEKMKNTNASVAKVKPRAATVPQPFNLSKSREKRNNAKAASKTEWPIRRVPAFFTLHHEILTDRGIVNQTVDWESREYVVESASSQYHTIPAPVNVDEFYSEDTYELVDYVKKHARSFGDQPLAANIPSSSKHEEKWYAMCEVAGAIETLESASEQFLTWSVDSSENITESCHALKALVTQTLSIIADTAYAHDTLRLTMKKHKLPWNEKLISQVRWDAQHAAFVIMRAALDCADEAERKRGAFKRQKNVLKPLGQAVIATFSVHQLSGGFGGEAAQICDELVDLTVHYARLLDPKWFRGTKVVRS
ncbi:hypothetical protein M9435_001394 [Picochlorum sp. BPE23]|nr:hypothetical protein M9435_001394 [Picochlorum sp. BPE23]